MRILRVTVSVAISLCAAAAPAAAQAGLDKIMKRVEQAKEIKNELRVSDEDERALGEDVSQRIRTEFGVFQDRDVTKYVTLVGTALAKASARPALRWEFIVLDTDGVNAFASPGGIVHITRGALGLIKSEAELAGVLGHEIAHITRKHTVNSIQKNKGVKLASSAVPGTHEYIGALANAAYDNIVERGFDRGDEEDADAEGVRLAHKLGYDPEGLSRFLVKLAERNRGVTTRNALFASHPETEGRLGRLSKQIKSERLTASASVEGRYRNAIEFDAKDVTQIAAVADGSRGLAEGSSPSRDKTAEAPKKKGFGLGALKLSGGKQAESTQASASAGNRAVGVDRHAKGGSNPSKLTVIVTPAELEAFKRGIAG
jgi:predicted Zn-dependent protease